MVTVSVKMPSAAIIRAFAQRWPMVALVAEGRKAKSPVTTRAMRAKTWRYQIADAPDAQAAIIKLGLSGAGAWLLVCEEVIGPERIGDAVRRALVEGALDGERLLDALPHCLCVAVRDERVTLMMRDAQAVLLEDAFTKVTAP